MLKLYNTLTRQKEVFKPIKEGEVSMYSCGPTVYNFAHIGNMRTFLFVDTLRRVLKYNGYRLKGVMNITDVGHLESDSDTGEDKMQAAAKKENRSPYEIAEFYTKAFFEDLKKLNIERPEYTPKATDYINQMIDFVQKLVEKGYGYETSDGIYFDISKFAEYGKLSGINLEDQIAGARVEVNPEKRNPFDFALWKKAPKEHIMQWPSPWGMGYPGWHIECSALGREFLGEEFDIHSGGVDHIPIHHENEIAQTEALTGKPAVRIWMHSEFMMVDNGKMSKSLGNTYTISDLEKRGFDPMDFRYFCLNTHYRKKLNFTFEGLEGAKIARKRLIEQLTAHKNAQETDLPNIKEYYQKFAEAINDDLNIPLALGVLWTALKEPKSKAVYEFAIKADEVLGLKLKESASDVQREPEEIIPQEIEELARQRIEAKKAKNYALADELRSQINSKGYIIIDTPQGYKINKK
ncbi:MAG TPA: cysteine--tRNA ligase [Clostridia bacterium]|jgi:cysteinyl-tRNA synthetase